MSEKKIIAVLGATGAQGGGLARAILADPTGEFTLRALTRDPQSAAAKELAARGAEVVAADLEDVASLTAAFAGVHGAYIVTNYWAPLTEEEESARGRAEMELAHASNAAQAAKAANVKHVIWSTLEDTRDFFGTDEAIAPNLEGAYKVPHFDVKSEANELFFNAGVPTTLLFTTFYYENWAYGLFTSREDGKLRVTAPIAESPLSGIATEDVGKAALAIFKRGDEFIGKSVAIAGDHLTGAELASIFGKVFGEEVEYRPYTFEEFRSYPFTYADEYASMFQYYAQNSAAFVGARDLEFGRELNPALQSFETWLEANKANIPVG